MALLAACVPQYDACYVPGSRVADPRVIAVRADPPEALLDDAGVPPPVRVRALLGGGFAGQPLEADGQVCVPADDDACAGEGEPLQLSALDLNEARFVASPSKALVDAARAADPLLGYGGVRVLAVLRVRFGGVERRAAKLLLFSPPGTVVNQPLEITGLSFRFPDGHDQLHQTDGLILGVAETLGVTPILTGQEEYDVVDLSGQRVHLREHVTYDFFATPHMLYGDLPRVGNNPVERFIEGADRADEPEPGAAPLPDGLVRLTGFAESHGTVWAVARDGRGGVAWLGLPVTVEDRRVCFGAVSDTPSAKYCPPLESGCN